MKLAKISLNATDERLVPELKSRAKKINLYELVPAGTGGRPKTPDEIILRAILYRLRQGGTWRALSIFAPYTTIYTRWKQWV